MTSALHKLAAVASPALRAEPVQLPKLAETFGDAVAQQLGRLLQLKNGFYAFEGALHVRTDTAEGHEIGMLEWNRDSTWRSAYKGMAGSAVFFAEDVFGTQFCYQEGRVATFDPETGAFEVIADDLEGWAKSILDEEELWTGHKLAHDWQAEHGRIPVGSRLVPITPFVLGGNYSVDNLYALEATKAMRFRATIAVQIRDLPDGTPITLRVVE